MPACPLTRRAAGGFFSRPPFGGGGRGTRGLGCPRRGQERRRCPPAWSYGQKVWRSVISRPALSPAARWLWRSPQSRRVDRPRVRRRPSCSSPHCAAEFLRPSRGILMYPLAADLRGGEKRKARGEGSEVLVHPVACASRNVVRPADDADGDVRDVVARAAAVRPPCGIGWRRQHGHAPLRGERRRRRPEVEPQELREPAVGRIVFQEQVDELLPSRSGCRNAEDELERQRQPRIQVVIEELLLVLWLRGVPAVLVVRADDRFVDERICQALDLDPRTGTLCRSVVA